MTRVLVIGGNGRTGRHIVQKLTQFGDGVCVLTRQVKADQTAPVEFIAGDITHRQDVEAAVRDVDGVVIIVESAESDDAPNSPEQVHYQGTRNVLTAIGSKSVQIVLVTQIYITRPERYPEASNIIHWRQQAEEAVRSSGLPYTLVRPRWLTNDAGTPGIRFEQGDRGEGQVARTTRSNIKKQMLLDKGADHVIVTNDEDLVSRVMEITKDHGADLIFDAVAGSLLETLATATAPKATIFVYGALDENAVTPFPLFAALQKGLKVQGHTLFEITTNPVKLEHAKQYIYRGLESGKLVPILDRTFTLDQIVEAHRYMESNQQNGKIPVTVP